MWRSTNSVFSCHSHPRVGPILSFFCHAKSCCRFWNLFLWIFFKIILPNKNAPLLINWCWAVFLFNQLNFNRHIYSVLFIFYMCWIEWYVLVHLRVCKWLLIKRICPHKHYWVQLCEDLGHSIFRNKLTRHDIGNTLFPRNTHQVRYIDTILVNKSINS